MPESVAGPLSDAARAERRRRRAWANPGSSHDRVIAIARLTLPAARGRGIAPRALDLATSYAMSGLGLHRVQLQHALDNTASCRVAEKAGFTLEGFQRGSCLLASGYVDEHLHARVAGA